MEERQDYPGEPNAAGKVVALKFGAQGVQAQAHHSGGEEEMVSSCATQAQALSFPPSRDDSGHGDSR